MDTLSSDSVRRVWFSALLGVVAAGFAAVSAQGQSAAPAKEQSDGGGLPAPLAGFADDGAFTLYVNEDRLVTMRFAWRTDGSFEGQSTLSMAGQTVDSSIKITPTPDGRWSDIAMQTALGPIAVKRKGSQASVTFKGKTETVTMKPGTILFENFTPALMSQGIRAYDTVKGGKQDFALFIIPHVVMDGSIELKDRVERSVGGRDLVLSRYTYALPGVDVTVWADAEGKIYLADVPAQHAAYVRDGYETLRLSAETDPKLSKPKYAIVEDRGVMVAMRDGVKLSTDIYRPDAEGAFPVILTRTPYKKEMSELDARYYARRGYVVAVQDCRGRFASQGEWEPFVNEPHDGYDTIEWLAGQSWSTGKVGMVGASYLGWVQWWAARDRPPHLVTIIPNVSPPDPFYNIPYEYGVFFLTGAIWWADILESEATGDLSGAAFREISEKKYARLLRSLPVIDLDERVLGKRNRYWRTWIEHPVNDAYWQRASFLDRLKNVRIPVFHQSGWFDGDGIGSKLNYLRMVSCGHPNQKLVLGPWGHTPQAQRRIGDRDFGSQAIIDLPRQYLRWFDHWLKGVDNGIMDEPLVSVFVMGSNKWLHGDVYPLPETRFKKLYLSSGGAANTSQGDGRLVWTDPPADAPVDRYAYDPADPTPNPEYYEEPDDESPEGEHKVRSVEDKKKKRQAYHQTVTNARRDILVYTTEPMSKPLTFVGPLSAVLYASSSARDTDWFVRLMEIDEDGKIFQLAEGKIRARFRQSMTKPELLEPGTIYEYQIDLWQTGITVPVGHRLRAEVASASFPIFSRNLNTGGHNEKDTDHVVAEQTIYHSARYPSHILLPVIPDMDEAQALPSSARGGADPG